MHVQDDLIVLVDLGRHVERDSGKERLYRDGG
jgi:hypothetical protein